MSTVVVLPSTLDGIKRLARTIKRERGLPHHAALDEAARKAGYENVRHAQRVLEQTPTPSARHAVFLTAYWRDKGGAGRETLRIELPVPLTQLATRAELRSGRNLHGFKLEYEDHLEQEVDAGSKVLAQGALEDAARTLVFMAATGLVPALRSLDQRLYHMFSRLPGRDHPSAWRDRSTEQWVYLDEPYSHVRPDERAQWCAMKGWQMLTPDWEGLYAPGMSRPYVFCETPELAARLIDQLTRLPRGGDMGKKPAWPLASGAYAPHVSPARERDGKARRSRPMPALRGVVRDNALPYGASRGGMTSRWRPAKALPLETHLKIGPLLAALANSELPALALRSIGQVRSELDDWLQMEYPGAEMTAEQFHAAYYGEHRPAISGKAAQLAALDQVIQAIRVGYPACRPQRSVIERLQKAGTRISDAHG